MWKSLTFLSFFVCTSGALPSNTSQKLLVLGVLDFVLTLCLVRYFNSIAIRYVTNMVGLGFVVSTQKSINQRYHDIIQRKQDFAQLTTSLVKEFKLPKKAQKMLQATLIHFEVSSAFDPKLTLSCGFCSCSQIVFNTSCSRW